MKTPAETALLHALTKLYDWVESNVPYGTPKDLAKIVDAALKKAGK